MGEQGAESIHAHISRLETQCQGIIDPLQRLQYVVQEYNVESTPGLNSMKLEPRAYRKRSKKVDM